MDIFINILIFIHIFGLVLGMGSGMAMAAAQRLAIEPTTGFEKLTDGLVRNGQVGLALLWISGPMVVWLKYGGFFGFSFWFWIKIAFVVALSAGVGMGAASYRKVKNGDLEAAKRAKLAGMVSGLSGLGAILAAVFAFN